MTDEIIIGLLLVFVFIGIRSSVKHFKGQGGCCGGSSEIKSKKKKLKNVIGQKTVQIEGMTCENCKNRVESRLNNLEGLSAKVSLKKKTAILSMEKEIEDEQIRAVIKKAGYKVIRIQ